MTTMRERIMAFLQGRKTDRVPFVQYDGCAAPNSEIWAIVGRNNMGALRWSGVHRTEHPRCKFESTETKLGRLKAVRTVMHTPKGDLTELKAFEPVLGSGSIKEHYVKEPKDYEVLLAHLKDVKIIADIERVLKDQRGLGDDGVPHVSMARTPWQQLWVQWVSIEDLALHMADCPDLVEACIAEMARQLQDIFWIVARAPVPYIVFPDNITAPMIGEKHFQKYCVPLYDELGELLKGKGIPIFVHMDGDLKPLWKAIGSSAVRGLDSMSPPPDNDTSVKEALRMWPEMRVGINFPSSMHVRSAKEVYDCATKILNEGGHSGRLQIQVSENVPPGAWKTSYPAIVKAIEDFGKP